MVLNIGGIDFLIDDEDAPAIIKHKWRIVGKRRNYATNENNTRLHRLIINAGSGDCVDHIDGNTFDCRKSNLRICDYTVNARNRIFGPNRKRSSKYCGVFRQRGRSKYRAEIYIDGKCINLGTYSDEQDAAKAYNSAAQNILGYARVIDYNNELLCH
jgi:hypothetical protein